MTLPNAQNADVSDKKLLSYVLDHNYPQNQGKAAFFEIVGFTLTNPDDELSKRKKVPDSVSVVCRYGFGST